MARQSERSAATIDGILSAARKLFMSRGFEAVSIDDIAAAAGIAKGGVSHHFSSKQSIFEVVLDRAQADAAKVETDLKRGEQLRKDDAIPQAQLDNYKSSAASAQAAVAQARAQLSSAQEAKAGAPLAVELTPIRNFYPA